MYHHFCNVFFSFLVLKATSMFIFLSWSMWFSVESLMIMFTSSWPVHIQLCWSGQTDPLQRCDQWGPQQPTGARAEGGGGSPQGPAVRAGPGRHHREWVWHGETRLSRSQKCTYRLTNTCTNLLLQFLCRFLFSQFLSHIVCSLLCPISVSLHRPRHHRFEMCV